MIEGMESGIIWRYVIILIIMILSDVIVFISEVLL